LVGSRALVDPVLDERLDPLRGSRVRLVEGRVAGRAHHLPLERGQRGPRLGTRGGGRGNDERDEDDERDPPDHDPSAASMPRSNPLAPALHGPHHEAQKLSTTGWPRKDASSSFVSEPRRFSVNRGAGPPIFGGCDWCVSRQISSASSPATAASARSCAPSFSERVI